ncbi:MAG: transglutaminase family protein [Candidatus Paceibacterota bacterium]|jgi:hypothetical protein
MNNEELAPFLEPTFYCDVYHPSIQKVALEFQKKALNQVDLAKLLFYFVRDETYYRVGHWTKKASQTLKNRSGTCTNNANLLIALLRAQRIPAGYGVMNVVGQEYFGPVILPNLARNVSSRSKHVYCFVYLNNKWIKCDPSDDEPLSLSTHHLNPQSRIVEWDGNTDAMLNLDPDHILNDEGPIANIDHIIGKKMKYRRMIPVFIGNKYIQFLRERGKYIDSIDHLDPAFRQWLFMNNVSLYIFYRIYFVLESIIRGHKINAEDILNIN